MIRYIAIFLCGLFSVTYSAWAQDAPKTEADTSKNKKKDSVNYSPKTTTLFYEYEVLEHRYQKRHADTSYYNRHRYNYLQRNLYQSQDLGTMGSAFQYLGYHSPERLGTRLGISVYDAYLTHSDSLPYFNTMSPYTNLDYTQGGKGRIRLNIDFSRNITADWGVSLYYRQVESDKMFGNNARENDIYALLREIGASMVYFSPSHRYKIFGNFMHYDHIVNDNGGYQVDAKITDLDSLFRIEDQAQLVYRYSNSRSRQSKRKMRLYQQYALFDSSSVQIYHTFDWSRQWNSYEDAATANTKGFYYQFPLDPTKLIVDRKPISAYYNTILDILDNSLGVKGKIAGLYYRFYGQMRQYEYQVGYLNTKYKTTKDTLERVASPKINTELYAGGVLRYDFSDSLRAGTEFLYLLGSDYRIRGYVESRWANLEYLRSSYRPSLLQRRFYGTFYDWNNENFEHTQSDQIRLNTSFSVPYVHLKPFVNWTRVSNYIYFDSTGTARQSAETQNYLQAGTEIIAKWSKLVSRSTISWTNTRNAKQIRIPEWQLNTQIYWESPFFRKATSGQVGLDFHWKSRYFANGYNSAIQQFVVQDRFSVGNYLLVDAFFNFRVKRVQMFVKFTNLLQNLWRGGYSDTPTYFAQPRVFELGASWKFFD